MLVSLSSFSAANCLIVSFSVFFSINIKSALEMSGVLIALKPLIVVDHLVYLTSVSPV
ncbi:hypothetical protein ME801_17960 [Lactobacillus delbrueckii]|nr:hypothetical protein ME801_17960 [Lactobacillus delbrueckii]